MPDIIQWNAIQGDCNRKISQGYVVDTKPVEAHWHAGGLHLAASVACVKDTHKLSFLDRMRVQKGRKWYTQKMQSSARNAKLVNIATTLSTCIELIGLGNASQRPPCDTALLPRVLSVATELQART